MTRKEKEPPQRGISSAALWAEQARYDLDTARAMFTSGRYLYVLFCYQQALEKMLKSIIAKRNRVLPPRIHQLVKLAEVAGISVTEEQADFFRELSAYYIQTRYPQDMSDLAARVKKVEARRVLRQTVEMLEWAESMKR